MSEQQQPPVVKGRDFLAKRFTWECILTAKDGKHFHKTTYDGKKHPGFASITSAMVAWRKLGKPEGAVIVDFAYCDQSYATDYSEVHSRFAIFLPTPTEQQQ